VFVTGKWERDDESSRIIASEIHPISIVSERLARRVNIRLTTPPHDRATFERLWDIFARHKGDRPVAFAIEVREDARTFRITVDVNAQIRVRPSETLVSDVEHVCGAGSVTLR
jgi:DNA polymerase-3 subunit alpha